MFPDQIKPEFIDCNIQLIFYFVAKMSSHSFFEPALKYIVQILYFCSVEKPPDEPNGFFECLGKDIFCPKSVVVVWLSTVNLIQFILLAD